MVMIRQMKYTIVGGYPSLQQNPPIIITYIIEKEIGKNSSNDIGCQHMHVKDNRIIFLQKILTMNSPHMIMIMIIINNTYSSNHIHTEQTGNVSQQEENDRTTPLHFH